MNSDDKKRMQKLAEQLSVKINMILNQIEAYDEMDELNSSDYEEYQKLKEVVVKAVPVLQQMSDLFGVEVFRAAEVYYYSIKERALAGNADAIEIYRDLKPFYEQALINQVDTN